VNDLPFQKGDRVAMLLNNLGATTQMELLIVNRKARQILADKGIEVARTDMGAYFTSQEMAGFSITLIRLDDELERLIEAPCQSLPFTQH
jgi:dihydroxyacetone kinase-like protein